MSSTPEQVIRNVAAFDHEDRLPTCDTPLAAVRHMLGVVDSELHSACFALGIGSGEIYNAERARLAAGALVTAAPDVLADMTATARRVAALAGVDPAAVTICYSVALLDSEDPLWSVQISMRRKRSRSGYRATIIGMGDTLADAESDVLRSLEYNRKEGRV